MNTLSRNVMAIALVAAFAAPVTALAAGHACHHPEQAKNDEASCSKMKAQSQKNHARMEAMQARMQAMEKTSDPKARMPMMKAQMEDMQAMMKDMENSCSKAHGKGGMDMKGHDMHEGMKGHDMHGGMGGQMSMPDAEGNAAVQGK